MWRRSLIGMAAGALLAVMVSGAVSADGGNNPLNYGQCHALGLFEGGWKTVGNGPLTRDGNPNADFPGNLHGPAFSAHAYDHPWKDLTPGAYTVGCFKVPENP